MSICPFARKVKGNLYLCMVDGKVSPNIFGIHTRRWLECPLYHKGFYELKAIQHCLVEASKIGPQAVEEVIGRIQRGFKVHECCNPPKSCKTCACYVFGKCLLRKIK